MSYDLSLSEKIILVMDQGVRDFNLICQHADGAFPTEVYETLQSIERIGDVEFVDDPISAGQYFPAPHPLNFEWRFEKKTRARVAELCNSSHQNIACFGTGTVFEELFDNGQNAIFYDNNKVLIDSKRDKYPDENLVCCDLNLPLATTTEFDVVIMDPPWYPKYFRNWLRQAQKFLKPDGLIISTIFPPLVRPKAVEEREELMSFMAAIGEVEYLDWKAQYLTPPFELNTLKANGLPISNGWRLCEVLSIQLHGESKGNGLEEVEDSEWNQFRINDEVIAVKTPLNCTGKLSYKMPYDDGTSILKSVSRRDPVRERINVWTSKNTGITFNRTDKLCAVLKLMDGGSSFQDAANKSRITKEEATEMQEAINLLTKH